MSIEVELKMNYGNEILAELAGISPLLAEMEKTNVFSVPEGYFTTVIENALLHTTEPIFSLLNSLSKSNLADTPTGYFENLSDTILNKVKQQTVNVDTASTILSPLLLNIKNENVFEIPKGYFENLADTILGKIKHQKDAESTILSPALLNIKDKNIFKTPQGYFENFAGTILNKIKGETISVGDELKTISPTLYSIKNETIFETPEGYFDNISNAVLNKVNRKPAKVVQMHKRSMFFKYASAAMVAGIAILGVYKFANKASKHATEFASLDPSIQNGIKMNNNQLAQELNNLSNDDIANYLAKNPTSADVAEITSDLDESNLNLPNADQYLLDNKTLDNYLSNNNLNQPNN